MPKLCITPAGLPDNYGKVACIKAIRIITRLGLKEAKDVVEAAAAGSPQELPANSDILSCHQEMTVLKANGLMITGNASKVDFIIKSLRSNAKMATDAEEYALAQDIIEVLSKHKK